MKFEYMYDISLIIVGILIMSAAVGQVWWWQLLNMVGAVAILFAAKYAKRNNESINQ